jgi:membrane-associated phospholipid phosphatase
LNHTLQRQGTMQFVSLLCLCGFLLVALFKNNFASLNVAVNSWATSIQTSSFTPVAVMISGVFDTDILLPISLVVALALFFSDYREYSPLLIGSMGGNAAILLMAKTLVQSPRPTDALVYDPSYSFPSGEVTSCIVFFGLLAYLIWQWWSSSGAKQSCGMLFVAIVPVVGFDRIYLNVHWFTDVLGGCLLGVFWMTFSVLVFQYLETTGKIPGFLMQRQENNKQTIHDIQRKSLKLN